MVMTSLGGRLLEGFAIIGIGVGRRLVDKKGCGVSAIPLSCYSFP
jgi:hypothetical protein